MSNPSPKTEQLALGRGKRPKLNHQTVGMRMSPQTRYELERIAQSYDCLYGGKPWIAGLLEKIGSGELLVVPSPPPVPPIDPKAAMKSRLQSKLYSSSSEEAGRVSSAKEEGSASNSGLSQHSAGSRS